MKIWTVTYNDDNGSPHSIVATSAEAANEAARDWINGYAAKYPNVDFDRPWRDVFSDLCEEFAFIDSVTVEEHSLPFAAIVGTDEQIELILATVHMDSQSTAFAKELRDDLGDVLAEIEVYLSPSEEEPTT